MGDHLKSTLCENALRMPPMMMLMIAIVQSGKALARSQVGASIAAKRKGFRSTPTFVHCGGGLRHTERG